jgi:hypothetical protein
MFPETIQKKLRAAISEHVNDVRDSLGHDEAAYATFTDFLTTGPLNDPDTGHLDAAYSAGVARGMEQALRILLQ